MRHTGSVEFSGWGLWAHQRDVCVWWVDPYADRLRCVRRPGRPLDGCCRGRWCGCSWRWRCPRTPCGWRSSGGLATNTPPRCSSVELALAGSRCFVCSARMESCQPSPHNSLCPWSSGNIPVEHRHTRKANWDNGYRFLIMVILENIYFLYLYEMCISSRVSPGTVLTSTWLYIKYVPSSRTSSSPERECILNTLWWIEIILQFFNTPSDKSHKQTPVNTQSSVMTAATHS